MSKYGPAWVWPAASKLSSGQAPPLEAFRRGRALPQQAQPPPHPCRLGGGVSVQSQGEHIRQVCAEARTRQKHGEAPRKGRWWPQAQEKEKSAALGTPPPRPGIYPAVPKGSDATLTHGGGLAHQRSGEEDRAWHEPPGLPGALMASGLVRLTFTWKAALAQGTWAAWGCGGQRPCEPGPWGGAVMGVS